MFSFGRNKQQMVDSESALGGRSTPINTSETHFVLGTPINPPDTPTLKVIYFGMGCFWGAERKFWTLDGVFTTAVGYSAGYTPNPTYEEVCSGRTGHNEVVQVVYDETRLPLQRLFNTFWENHDPTQGMRQGNDVGTQYRSGIYTTYSDQRVFAEQSRASYQKALSSSGFGEITTELLKAGPFFYAEAYHQQYLAKNPNGYCGLGGTGVSCPAGLEKPESR